MNEHALLEDQLRDQLLELYDNIRNERDRNGPEEAAIDADLDKFLIEWNHRIIERQTTELAETFQQADANHPSIARPSSVQEEAARAKLVFDDMSKAQAAIVERAADLRYILVEGVRDISRGLDPTLTIELARRTGEDRARQALPGDNQVNRTMDDPMDTYMRAGIDRQTALEEQELKRQADHKPGGR